MPTRAKPKRQLAICIRSEDPDLLTPRRIYEVLPDESAAKSRYIRVIDDEGEDYLYPAAHFVFITKDLDAWSFSKSVLTSE